MSRPLITSIKPRNQRGFVASVIMLVVLAAVTAFFVEWLNIQSRKAEAKQYDAIVKSQMYILDGLEQYFDVACNQNGVVPSVTFNELVTGGYLDEAAIHNPNSYAYNISVERPSITFDPNTNRAVAQGRTKLRLFASIADVRARTKIIERYRNYDVEFSVAGDVLTVMRLYRVDEADELEGFLNDGITAGGSGSTFVCI